MNLVSILNGYHLPEVLFFNAPAFWDLLVRFIFNFTVTLVISRYIYYRKTKRKDYLFTFLLINTMVFLLAYLLSDVELKLGFAFGLFALFGILRYRTNPVRIREMTYLFVLIGIAVINAVSDKYVPYSLVLLANFLVAVILWVLEFVFVLRHESSRRMIYERLELVHQKNQEALIADLTARTGVPIHRVEIISVNFVRSRAEIIIYYDDEKRIVNAKDDLYRKKNA